MCDCVKRQPVRGCPFPAMTFLSQCTDSCNLATHGIDAADIAAVRKPNWPLTTISKTGTLSSMSATARAPHDMIIADVSMTAVPLSQYTLQRAPGFCRIMAVAGTVRKLD